MSGPLSGITIIELAGIGPGPFAGMLLSDMGATVIRVERSQAVRGGDPAKPPKDISNRGRLSIGVDLKNPEGVEVIMRLVEKADALFEGFRPGVTERLGLGPDECAHPCRDREAPPHEPRVPHLVGGHRQRHVIDMRA